MVYYTISMSTDECGGRSEYYVRAFVNLQSPLRYAYSSFLILAIFFLYEESISY